MSTKGNKFSGLASAIKERQSESKQAEETKPEKTEDGTTSGVGGGMPVAVEDAPQSSLKATETPPEQPGLPLEGEGKTASGKKNRLGALTKAKRKRGRPANGKRSNSDYQQITLYVPRLLYQSVQAKLKKRREGRKFTAPRDMSDLVAMLVKRWDDQSHET